VKQRTPQNLLPTLPVTPDSRQSRPDLRRVSCSIVAAVIEGQYPDVDPFVFDCRYGYEYHGGHIRGAIHALSLEDVEAVVFSQGQLALSSRAALIFHCEFSQERAPNMIARLRRSAREHRVLLPQMYIMKGGYHEFFGKRPDLCEPQFYVPMHSASHSAELEANRRAGWGQQRNKKRKTSKTWSRFSEDGREDSIGRSLAHSWDGEHFRMPFADEEADTLWSSLDIEPGRTFAGMVKNSFLHG